MKKKNMMDMMKKFAAFVMAFDNTVLTPISFNYDTAFATDDSMFMSNLMWVESDADRTALYDVTAVWNALYTNNENGVLFTVRFRLNAGVHVPFTTVTLNGVDVLGHDGTNGFDIVDIATNLSDAPYTMVINLDTSQGNQDSNSQGGNNQGGNSQGGNSQGNNNDQGNRRPSGDGNQQ